MEHVDSVVTGEAESVWPQVLEDARPRPPAATGTTAGCADLNDVPPARHDLLPAGYAFGAIQTTRGCPLNCSFCSVTAFNGARYRQRPIPDVVREFHRSARRRVLVVDDNLIGTRPDHIARAKDLFRAMAEAESGKEWICPGHHQLRRRRGTPGAGREGPAAAASSSALSRPRRKGCAELGKKFNLQRGRDFRASVRRIQRHHILVVGSFIIGLDVDEPGIGRRIAEAASAYGVDISTRCF